MLCTHVLQIYRAHWVYVCIKIWSLATYVFEVGCWLILAAVINPVEYMPYSVATITLATHAWLTFNRWVGWGTGLCSRGCKRRE